MGKELTNNEMAKIILANLNELKGKELSSGIYFKSIGRKYVTIVSKNNKLNLIQIPIADFFNIHIDPVKTQKYLEDFEKEELERTNRLNRTYDHCTKFRNRSNIKEEDLPTIIERLKNGETERSLAIEYGTTDASIIRVKKKFCPTALPAPYPRALKELVKQKYLSGESNGDIATELGLNWHTVWLWTKKLK